MLTADQIEGAEFLAARPVAMLGDKAGFGKSAQFTRACDLIAAAEGRELRVTILCPPILRPTEAAEWEKWTWLGRPATIIRSGKDVVPEAGLVVCSYKLAAENAAIHRALVRRRADVLILDEAHYLKERESKRFKSVFLSKGIASTSRRIWFVTATPTPNNAGEFWPFARACGAWPDTYNRFVEQYCETTKPPETDDPTTWFKHGLACGTWREGYKEFLAAFYTKVRDTTGAEILAPRSKSKLLRLHRDKIVGVKNPGALKALLAPYVLARNRVDPARGPLTIDTIEVEGDRPDYSEIPPDVLAAIDEALAAGDWRVLEGAAVATVRRQIGTAKAKAVAELARHELSSGVEKLLVFAEHTSVIDTIAHGLGDMAAIIDGRTPQRRREELTSPDGKFQAADWPRVLICQRAALKEGVTLTRATRVLLAEPPWVPDDCEQMIARAWRRGQTQHVRASYVYLPDSYDSRISGTLARKSAELSKIDMSVTR